MGMRVVLAGHLVSGAQQMTEYILLLKISVTTSFCGLKNNLMKTEKLI